MNEIPLSYPKLEDACLARLHDAVSDSVGIVRGMLEAGDLFFTSGQIVHALNKLVGSTNNLVGEVVREMKPGVGVPLAAYADFFFYDTNEIDQPPTDYWIVKCSGCGHVEKVPESNHGPTFWAGCPKCGSTKAIRLSHNLGPVDSMS